ncbi:MAG: photosystem P840 reaction-center cytochrome c-551 [Syntrophorhabdaceae bacterium]|nr:photosystem P840 reaction-center cytochrome c-551 [Syntrophorhabdaceae bacterium]
MKTFLSLGLIAMFIFLTTGMVYSSDTEKVDKAKELFEKKCSACHGFKKATSVQKTAEEWDATVQRMKAKRNSNITDEDAKIITEYLSLNYGKKK